MEELLNPSKRPPKLSRFNADVTIPLGPRLWDGQEERQVVGFTLVIPAGTTAGGMASFQHKRFADDLVMAKLKPDALDARLAKQLGPEEGKLVAADLRSLMADAVKDPSKLVDAVKARPRLVHRLQLVHRRRRERGPSLRRRPARSRQEGADRLPRDAVGGDAP